jgi:hypothetical protein
MCTTALHMGLRETDWLHQIWLTSLTSGQVLLVLAMHIIVLSEVFVTQLYLTVTQEIANTMEQCSLFLPLLRGAGPMALMLWLNG